MSLDGMTSGPKSFEGPIGRAIKQEVQFLDFIKFSKVLGSVKPLPKIISKELSRDQLYLYKICRGIMAGELPGDLTTSSPGALSHARCDFEITYLTS